MTESNTPESAVIHSEDGTELTVTLVEAVDGVPAAPLYQDDVPTDARLVGARLRIENTGSGRYDDYIEEGALLIDAADQQYEPTSIKTSAPSLTGGIRLEAGDRRAGMIAFVLPNSEEPASIHLSLERGHGPDRAVWNLVE
jgi:hypothetical protein